jgi:hypothetical protein
MLVIKMLSVAARLLSSSSYNVESRSRDQSQHGHRPFVVLLKAPSVIKGLPCLFNYLLLGAQPLLPASKRGKSWP